MKKDANRIKRPLKLLWARVKSSENLEKVYIGSTEGATKKKILQS